MRAQLILTNSGPRHGEAKRCADPSHRFNSYRSTLRLNAAFQDRQSQPGSAVFLRIGLEFLEDIVEAVFWDAGSIITDQTLNGTSRINFARIKDHFAARRIGDGISEQILENTFEQARIRIDYQ